MTIVPHDALGSHPDPDDLTRTVAGSSPQGGDAAQPPQRGRAKGPDEASIVESMRIVRRSIDYAMILAVAGLGIMVTVLFLQGFKIGGFDLDVTVLTALVPSLSAAAALRVLGGPGRGIMLHGRV